MSGLIPPHDDIVWHDMPDGIHQKGVRVSKPGEGHIRAEMFTRVKRRSIPLIIRLGSVRPHES